MQSRLSKIADEYERLIATGSINWLEVDKSTLPKSTLEYVNIVLAESGITYKIADIRLDDIILFKLDDQYVHYLHCDSATSMHQWADEGFHNGLNGNEVLAYLKAKSIGNPDLEWMLKSFWDTIDTVEGVDPTAGQSLSKAL